MGLKDKVAKSVQNALKSVGDLANSVTYVAVTLGGYDIATDTQARTLAEYAVIAAQVGLTEQEVDYFPGNRVTLKLLIAALDLPVVPKVEDYVLIDAVKWEVKRVKEVPGRSLWIIFVQVP